MSTALIVAAAACALLAFAGAAYFVLSVWAARRFQLECGQRRLPLDFVPPVSILKSLKGLDPHMDSAFRSHCMLDYPEYEMLFGVSDRSEPAVALVERLQQEFPAVSLRIVDCPESLGSNGKVSNLAQMLPQAKYEHVLINDSDIRVGPHYLQRVTAMLAAERRVGMVTTLYRAIAGRTVWSKLEALGISTDFMGGVLIARELEHGIHFALGATMATTKAVLREIGGLAALAEHLGDDYELGARTAAAGYRVELADMVVETALPDYSFAQFWSHQMRWSRNVKDRRGAQYFGLVVSFGLIWGILAVLLQPHAWWAWASLEAIALARLAAALICGRIVLRDRQVVRDLWLVPLRDLVALCIWIASYLGSEVEWRGERFHLHKGRLEKRT